MVFWKPGSATGWAGNSRTPRRSGTNSRIAGAAPQNNRMKLTKRPRVATVWAILSVSVAAATPLFACRSSPRPSPPPTVVSSPCPPTWTRLPGTFGFQWANEGHTGRVYVLACPEAVTALTDFEWRALMDRFRDTAAAAQKKKVSPFKPCGRPSQIPSLAPRANEVLRRQVFIDVCFDITASV